MINVELDLLYSDIGTLYMQTVVCGFVRNVSYCSSIFIFVSSCFLRLLFSTISMWMLSIGKD